ncbi:MAG: haloalkane dehalogenase [Myxococcaceae bacterium]|nr:haloalkane dehalogenase [Myxococcaceae bacterium]
MKTALLTLGGVLCLSCAAPRNSARSIGDIDPLPPLPDCVSVDSSVPVLKTASGLEYVRTPESAFDATRAAFPFQPNYVEVEGLRLAYYEAGANSTGETIVLLHGQPDWAYLYRKMMPPLAAAGHRVIAVDLMGFGHSDKPLAQKVHTYEQHVAWVKALFASLDLQNVTLFCQDWGGLIGLRIVGDEPQRFARVVAANTTIPLFVPPAENPYFLPASVAVDCKATDLRGALGPAMLGGNVSMFNAWIQFSLTSPTFKPSDVMSVQIPNLPPEDAAAYDAPFPSFIYKAGVRTLPSMIAAVTTNNQAAWDSLGRFEKPFLVLSGERDQLLGRKEVADRLINQVPGAKGQKHARFDAGHFIQDEIGDTMAATLNAFIAENPRK